MRIPGPIRLPKQPDLARWLNNVREFAISCRIAPGVNYRVRHTTKATFLDIAQGRGGSSAAGGSSTQLPFTLATATESNDLTNPFSATSDPDTTYVIVKGGTIFWQDQDIVVEDSDTIVIPAPSTAFKVYLTIGDEFTSPPSFTFESSAAGWSGYPNHPIPPNRKYWLLAQCALSDPVFPATKGVLTITENWHGGDISWPGPFAAYY